MNEQKWDRIAEEFGRGEHVPANGWEAWNEQASREAVTIRDALPSEVETIVEIGCGVGRLTPYLALLFVYVRATDTSTACRMVTRQRCEHRPNVLVLPPGDYPADAAVVWGNLYDKDWNADAIREHRETLRANYPMVLEGNESRWLLHERGKDTLTGQITTFER